MNGLKNNK